MASSTFNGPGRISKWLGVPAPFDPQHTLVTSPFLPPLALAALRMTLAAYALFFVVFQLTWDALILQNANTFFSYFTHLSYIGLLAYFWAAAVQTLVYALGGGRKGYPLQRWHCSLQFLHVLLYSTITTYPIIVTIVFWSLLADPSTLSTRFNAWTNISQHALNTAFALFEIVLTHAGPSPWMHLPFCIVLLGCYLGVAYITHATQGFYTYSFLDPTQERARLAAYIVAIAVGECIVFALVRGLCVLREYYVRRRHLEGGRTPSESSEADDPEKLDDWEEVERPGTPTAI
ncbi:hypothetical protein A0H81_04742 [Grifola frondosa]|uniref:Uncharacterized protein n=1 Tax=Grifola frondosa TaxID=5627 RepID=A0A1C7MEY1_GRIFR|nr:hypothetical protein A0H81_04742 [Grifola frondosa]